MPKTRVLLVDDQQVFRAGLRALLATEPEFEVVGEAADTRTALAEVERTRPDLTLVDFWLPDGDGISLVRELRRVDGDRRVALLSAAASVALMAEALQAGACGVLLKLQPVAELIAGLRRVAQGERYLPPDFAASVAERPLSVDDQAPAPLAVLSAQEKEVFRMLVRGKSNLEIAHDLFLTIGAVEKHGERIMAKLGVASLADLVRFATERQLLES